MISGNSRWMFLFIQDKMEAAKKKLMNEAFRSGRYSKAIKIADQQLKIDPGDWDAIYMKASIYSLPLPKYCDYYTAIGMIMFGVDSDRTDINRWHAAGDIFDMSGIYAEAERCYRKVLEMDPINYKAIISFTVLQGAPGTQITKEEAKALLETAISSKPNEWNAYHHLANLLRELGDNKKALELYESALVRITNTENEKFMRNELERQIKILKDKTSEQAG
jgi:tetratricopeptide (TPR) repeat protein